MRPILIAALTFAFMGAVAPAGAQQRSDTIAPEAESGRARVELVEGERHMLAAANPLAAKAGLEMLRAGGSAADAAIAVQAVLGLVEPQSSGLGGGAFALWYDASSGKVTSFDARETAPQSADETLFLDENGEPLAFFEAVVGGRSVGVPGVPMLLETLHERFGRLERAETVARAIELAREGFKVSPRLASLLEGEEGRLDNDPAAADYFFADGEPLMAGTLLRNPAYADALELFAREGAAPFYTGAPARGIVDAVRSYPGNPGLLTMADMAAYEVKEREPVCMTYRVHEICGMGPPSSGGLTVGQILGMLSHYDLAALGPGEIESWRLIADATRLAFADRNLYMADEDFVDMPSGLLDRDYLRERARLLDGSDALSPEEVVAGDPPGKRADYRPGRTLSQPATSHFVIVDEDGNVASITSSIENAFGARLMANGYLLNNQLTDFSFAPRGAAGELVANRAEGGKRPRSSMSPTIILQEDQPVYALGSPGGAAIIPYVARTIIALIDWRMDMAEAIALPHRVNMFGPYLLEAGTEAVDDAAQLQALGYPTESTALTSGLHGIAIRPDGLYGAADPRREGIAVAD